MALFSKKRGKFYCADCENDFETASPGIEPQTVFLSYAHRNETEQEYDVSEELVFLIKAELEKDGHRVWMDYEGIRGGKNWREEITGAIINHKHFFAFLSRRSVRQGPNVCLNEVAIAIKNNRIIQTILTENEKNISPPLTLSSIQWHKFQDWREIREGTKTGPKGEGWPEWFGGLMADIRQNLADLSVARRSGELAELQRILSPRSFTSDIIKNVEGFFGRKWLFDAYAQWLASDQRLFWLKGGPGIGKSSFAAALVHSGTSEVAGFFKCEYHEQKSAEESASECVRTLAYQLATRLPDYRIKLLRGQMIDSESVRSKNADDLFTWLITEPLNRAEKIAESHRTVLVIDGLDEAARVCDGRVINPLADLIHRHVDKFPDWLALWVTSRPEAGLQQLFGPKFESCVVGADTEQNVSDISEYLDMKLATLQHTRDVAELKQKILEKSGGTFLYLRRVENQYDLTAPELLPNGIDDVFFRDFSRFFPEYTLYAQEAEKFLRLLAASPGPLPRGLAQAVLGWSARDVTLKGVQPLSSLLEETEEGLEFYHKSVREWLLDGRRSGPYQVNPTGRKELGDFLWAEFEKKAPAAPGGEETASVWEDYFLDWLPGLLDATEFWNQIEALTGFCDYLYANTKYSSEMIVRARNLVLIRQKFGRDSVPYADELFKTGRTLEHIGRYQESREYLREAVGVYEKTAGPRDEKTAEALNYLALVTYFLADYGEAETLYRRALAIREQCLGADHLETAQTAAYLAGLLQITARLEEAQVLYERALRDTRAQLGVRHPDSITYLTYLAGIYEERGDYAESTRLFGEALAMNREVLDAQDPLLSLSIGYVGWGLASGGDFPAAEKLYEEALGIQESALGADHPYVARTLTYLGDVRFNQGDSDSARAFYEKSWELRKTLFGEDHPDTARTLMSVAWFKESRGEVDAAAEMYAHALQVFEATCGGDSADAGNARNHLASARLRYGNDPQKAGELLSQTEESQMRALGENHPYTLRTLGHLAELAVFQNLPEKACALLTNVFRRRETLLGGNHPDTQRARRSLKWVEENRGRFAGGREALEAFPRPNGLRMATR
jgi:tetratricopeptide (TPR) repeat protein